MNESVAAATAIETGDVKQIKEWIQSPSFVNIGAELHSDICGTTVPVVLAAVCGQVGAMELLVSAGASVDDCDNIRVTPCIAATQNGHVAAVAWLIERGADLARRNVNNRSALFASSTLESDAICVMLIEAGAPLDDDDDAKSRR